MLKQEIQNNLKNAMRAGETLKVSTLRMLLASLINREKEKRYKISKEKSNLSEEELVEGSQLSDQEIRAAIHSEIKKRREAIEAFEKGRRMDLVEKEKKEMEILQLLG